MSSSPTNSNHVVQTWVSWADTVQFCRNFAPQVVLLQTSQYSRVWHAQVSLLTVYPHIVTIVVFPQSLELHPSSMFCKNKTLFQRDMTFSKYRTVNILVGYHFPIFVENEFTYIYIYTHYIIYIYIGLRQNSDMDRPAIIRRYGSVWITCVLVWIGGMDRSMGQGIDGAVHVLTRSHIYTFRYI